MSSSFLAEQSIVTKLKMLFYKMTAITSSLFVVFLLPLEQSFKKLSPVAKKHFSEI